MLHGRWGEGGRVRQKEVRDGGRGKREAVCCISAVMLHKMILLDTHA